MTNNELKFNYIKRLWYMKDGVIYTKWGNKPKSFSCKSKGGHRYQVFKVNGKYYSVFIHEAVYMLYHNRPIADGKHIHHKDGDHENNAIENLIELTPKQHKRIHQYQCDDPMRGIDLSKGAWRFRWYGDDGNYHTRRFHGINEAMTFRARIEEPRRQELRSLGLNCKRSGSGPTRGIIRHISRKPNPRQWRFRQ